MRRPFVAGNWKMNLDLASGRALIAAIRTNLPPRPAIGVSDQESQSTSPPIPTSSPLWPAREPEHRKPQYSITLRNAGHSFL